jgi:imidazolonepropionase-like amidohydrolase
MKAEYLWNGTINAFQIARDAGVMIAAGSDSGGPCYPHSSLKSELNMLTSYGFSPMEAIISATRVNAEMMGLSEIGLLEKGKIADVIAVEGDPLKDIKTLSKVVLVIKDGKEISNSQIFE